MAYNTKKIPVSADPLPVNSHYNEAADAHQPTKGADGAARVRITDGDDEALGARDDAVALGDLSNSFSIVALSKSILEQVRLLVS